MSFFWALSPVLLIFILVVFFKTDLFKLAVVSFFYTSAVAAVVFGTSPKVLTLAAVDGVLTTLPLLLVVYTGILISQFLLEKDSLQRLTSIFSKGIKGNFNKALLVGAGFGNFFEGAGVIAEPVVAPMLYSSGVSPTGSAILSILGYAGLMHLALAGVIVTVLANVTSLPVQELATWLAILSLPATLFLYTTIPLFIGEPRNTLKHLPLGCAVALVITASAYLAVRWAGFPISSMLGGAAGILFLFVVFRTIPRFSRESVKDTAPFLFIFICLFIVNMVPSVKQLFAKELAFAIRVIPLHPITFRPLANAYLYLFGAFLLSYHLFSEEGATVAQYLRAGLQKALKPLLSMAIFGAVGSIIAFSGLKGDLSAIVPAQNMAHYLAQGLIRSTGRYYPVFAPLLGWMGTFLTGYGVASIMLFGKLQLATAKMLGVSQTLLASSLTVGASIGSISSPFKIAIASPLCNAQGKEGEILRLSIPVGMVVSLLVGIACFLI